MGRSAVQPAAELVAFTRRARGEDGLRWLERLPALVAWCEEAFGVTALEALPGGSQNCVHSAAGGDRVAARRQPTTVEAGRLLRVLDAGGRADLAVPALAGLARSL